MFKLNPNDIARLEQRLSDIAKKLEDFGFEDETDVFENVVIGHLDEIIENA